MQGSLLLWSLWRRRRRHVMSAFVMAITAAVVMLFVSVIQQLSAMSVSLSGESSVMVLAPWGSTSDSMPVAMYNTVSKIDGVQKVLRKKVVPGRHPNGTMYLVGGEEEIDPGIYDADEAAREAWQKARPTGAVMSESLANVLGLDVGSTIELPTGVGNLPIKVVAITRNPIFKYVVGVHFDYLQEFSKQKETSGYRVYVKPGDEGRVAKAIAEQTKNTSTPVQAFKFNELTNEVVKQAGAIPTVLGFLCVFLMLTTAIALANNNAIAVRERRIEVATLRVLGFYPGTIARLLLAETVLVGLIGGLVAPIVMLGLFPDGIQLTPGPFRLAGPVELSVLAIVTGVVVSVVVPLIGALPSTVAALRVPLVDGLRDAA